ncbi:MAG: helix-turn-helix protein [Acidobacteriota bacterium]|jgi:transcriptional regulator with XRE-family HTH domain|nr:helix-turn-helix protein [Acidobacteriota bacterium]
MIGSQVSSWRRKKGLTQEAAAQLSGVPRKQLWKLENDKIVTIETFRRVVTALEIPLLTLGTTEIVTHDLGLAELRQRAGNAIDALGKLRDLIDVLSPPAPPTQPLFTVEDLHAEQIIELLERWRDLDVPPPSAP